MDRIPLDELDALVRAAPDPLARLRPYLVADAEAGERPFDVVARLDPARVGPADPAAGLARDALLDLVIAWDRERRQHAFRERLRRGHAGPVLVCEGDSWFQFPFAEDTIDWLERDYAICSFARARDRLETMLEARDWVEGLREFAPPVMLLSAGGNDAVGDGRLQDLLRDFDPRLPPAAHLLPAFDDLLRAAGDRLARIAEEVAAQSPTTRLLIHGYDYVVPRDGRWLGRPMRLRGIEAPAFQAAIARVLIDRFGIVLDRLAAERPGVTVVDVRGAVGPSQWHDELHPDSVGFLAVAQRFRSAIRAALAGALG